MRDKYKIYQESINDFKYNFGCKKIFMFLSKEQYNKLWELKYKYHLSASTILRIIVNQYSVLKPIRDKMIDKPLYKTTKWRKTSVNVILNSNDEQEQTAKFYNNALIIYLDKIDKELLTPKIYEKIRNEIPNIMSNTTDPMWDYNEHYRQMYVMHKKFL